MLFLQGRIGILKVHARDKELDADVDFHRVARATAGSTGAELMNLMNQSAIVTVRQGRERITEVDIFEVSSAECCDQGCRGVAFQATLVNLTVATMIVMTTPITTEQKILGTVLPVTLPDL